MGKAESRFRRAQQAKRKKRATTPSPGQPSAPTDTRGLRAPVGERLPETCRRCGTPHSQTSDVQGGLCSACRFAEQRARWAE
jgi:ribosomal protein L37E